MGKRAEQVSRTDEGEVRGGELHVIQGGHVQGPAGCRLLHGTGGDNRLQNQGQRGGGEHAPQNRALHVTDEQGDGEEQAEEEDEGGPTEQVAARAEGHRNGGAGSVRHAADNTGVDQTNKGNEEADTDHNRGLERLGDRLKHRGTEAGEHQNGHDQTGKNDQAHDVCPGQVRGGGNGGGEQRIHAQASRHGEGLPGDNTHEDGHHAGNQRGHSRDGCDTEGAFGCVLAEADDEGVQHHDVAHGEERGEAAAEFCGDGGAAFGNLEVAVERTGGCCRLLGFRHVRIR